MQIKDGPTSTPWIRFLRDFSIIGCLMVWMTAGKAQSILIDEGISVNKLICFPIAGDSLSYRYLPTQGRLSLNQSLPEFSFLRYASINNTTAGTQSISEANGGGLVHFLALYDTPAALISQAESGLRIMFNNPEIKLIGPVLFSEGDYVVISSLLTEQGKEEKQLIGVGKAPVFENSKVAFSFLLNILDAQLLMESFKMETPDVSIMFELVFSGLTNAYQAKVKMNWAEVQKNEYYKNKTNYLFFNSQIQKSYSELLQSNALVVESFGTDDNMDKLLNVAYEKLMSIMFNPVRPNEIPAEQKAGLMKEVSGALGALTFGVIGSGNTYILRELKTEGSTEIFLNKRAEVSRRHIITFNIGNLYEDFKDDKRVFRDVVLEDPAFQQREIRIGIDGDLQSAFEHIVKSVSVSLRKIHRNGEETLRETLLTKSTLKESQGELSMVYLNHGDKDRLAWLDYEYQVIWNFGGEGTMNTGWIPNNAPILNLYAPYRRHLIAMDGDMEKLRNEDIRAVSVKISYSFFGKIIDTQVTVRTNEIISDKFFDITLPIDQHSVDYSITWIKNDGTKVVKKGIDDFGLIFIDELPGS